MCKLPKNFDVKIKEVCELLQLKNAKKMNFNNFYIFKKIQI